MKLLSIGLKKRNSLIEKTLAVGFLMLIEFFAVGAYLAPPAKFKPELGYLVKSGSEYLVLWLDENREQKMITSSSLASAISFASSELFLDVSGRGVSSYQLESLWLKNQTDSYALYWKLLDSNFVNRLTFTSKEEAEKFESLIKLGAYSPSPIGHALSLLPKNKN
ncbi:MAG: hypothetical protein EXR74_07150 [Bdellovibrionales bacterium]|nr:hypothetical protein [Bdellovibrionales bacterium]